MTFLPGQVYQLAGFDPGATATVCQVDISPAETIVHVKLEGVALPANPTATGGEEDGPLLITFSPEALQGSVGALLRVDAEPEGWERAYAAWHEAYEGGEATVWNLPVYDAIQVMESLAAAG